MLENSRNVELLVNDGFLLKTETNNSNSATSSNYTDQDLSLGATPPSEILCRFMQELASGEFDRAVKNPSEDTISLLWRRLGDKPHFFQSEVPDIPGSSLNSLFVHYATEFKLTSNTDVCSVILISLVESIPNTFGLKYDTFKKLLIIF